MPPPMQFDAVTNGRASGDYAGGQNWDVGGSSLLFWAAGMRPSKDNFWSGDGQKRQPFFTQVLLCIPLKCPFHCGT